MPNSKGRVPLLAAAVMLLPLTACGEEPGDQIIEIEDGYNAEIDNLETVSREADVKTASEMSNSFE